MEPFILEFDDEKCTGCGICVSVCPVSNQSHPDVGSGNVPAPGSTGDVLLRVVNGKVYPSFCYACAHAPCIEACPKEFIKRDPTTGIVYVLETAECRGCEPNEGDEEKPCIVACSEHTNNHKIVDALLDRVIKCDACGGDPLCAKNCPQGAIRFVPARSYVKDRKKALAEKMILSSEF
ncbi:MAG: 4Fe-4S binding protein [Promethearchaeota archaeon]